MLSSRGEGKFNKLAKKISYVCINKFLVYSVNAIKTQNVSVVQHTANYDQKPTLLLCRFPPAGGS